MEQNSFILLRHGYDDHSYIDGKNDTGLTTKGIEMAQNASSNLLYKVDNDKVVIRHSTKKRAKETAEIICEYFLKHNINCICINDNGLTELFQGNFNFGDMEHSKRVDFLQSCWDDFEYCRKSGNLNHHFGQNKDRKIVLTPGENHSEWSVRIANGVLNIINDLEQSYQSINVTHRGAILEIKKIIEMVNGKIQFNDVEQYETVWMNYCQDYLVNIDCLDKARVLTKKYICQRSKK